MTELEAAQLEVNRLARQERAMLAAMPDLIFELSADGVHRSYHAPHVDRLYAAPDDFVGRNVRDVLPENVGVAYQSAIDRTLTAGKMQVFDYQLSFADGKLHMYEARMVRKSADEVLVVVRDVTERHQLEDRLRQAQKMDAIGRLAGGVAHDFNNLLTVINGYAGMALQKAVDAESGQLLEDVEKAGQRAAGLTRQLLMFSRRQIGEPRSVNLNAVVVETERILRRLIGEDVELVTQLADDLPSVHIDGSQVEQVVVNLAVNSRDAMRLGGGRLMISTDVKVVGKEPAADSPQPGTYVGISVADTGVGMSEAVREQIFEPFFTTKEVGTGTGLGLAVVFGVVRENGGFIEVDTAVGSGTTIRLYWPAVPEAAAVTASPTHAGQLPRGTETILLVEDDAAVRAFTSRILVGCGYRLLEADDGRAAIGMMQSHSGDIDLLLTDVVMPMVNGRELAEVARQVRPGMSVVFMSGYTDDEVLRRGVLSAEVAFLMKPFTTRTLAERVRHALDERNRRRA